MKPKLQSREQAVRKNILTFAALTPSQKIRALEKQRKIIAYLKSLNEVLSDHEIAKRR
jgi:hypothetical protein